MENKKKKLKDNTLRSSNISLTGISKQRKKYWWDTSSRDNGWAFYWLSMTYENENISIPRQRMWDIGISRKKK